MARWSQERRAQARVEILAAAKEVFEAEGFEGATMRQIAAKAGLAVGTLFNYFADKRALLYATLHDDLERVRRECVETMPGVEAGLEGLLVHTAGCFYDYYAQRPALSRALLKESLWAQGEGGAAFKAQAQEVAGAVARRVVALQQAGALSAEASAESVTMAFFSHYYFVLLMELDTGLDPARMRALIGVLARQLEAGVGS